MVELETYWVPEISVTKRKLTAQGTQKPILWHWLLRKERALLRGRPAELKSVSQIQGSGRNLRN